MTMLRTALTVLLATAACTDVNGGAVEVSWDLREIGGADLDCEDARVARIRLWWEDALGSVRYDEFECRDDRGVTRFQLEPGDAALWLSPVCEDGTEAAVTSYRAPAPIVRAITVGDVITLDTQVIEVRRVACTDEEPCTCP